MQQRQFSNRRAKSTPHILGHPRRRRPEKTQSTYGQTVREQKNKLTRPAVSELKTIDGVDATTLATFETEAAAAAAEPIATPPPPAPPPADLVKDVTSHAATHQGSHLLLLVVASNFLL